MARLLPLLLVLPLASGRLRQSSGLEAVSGSGLAIMADSSAPLERDHARLAEEACVSQDAFHRARVQSQLKSLCYEMCKAVGLFPNCPHCKGSDKPAPAEFTAPGNPEEQQSWDDLIAHMDKMGVWSRDMIRHWEKTSQEGADIGKGSSQLQLSAQALDMQADQVEEEEHTCRAQDVVRRRRLEGKINEVCSGLCFSACDTCKTEAGSEPLDWPVLMQKVGGLQQAFLASVKTAEAARQ
eukprot:TRINITY_DN61849_c0_g1_i1.p1 TRINITY_DN61849_c0_g1~~TRINITY_DN61849_c0_g1_i1.p1  ORF type:complete len:254 (+),score=56.46 TRINITY_DN61849_c0_g1_i1:48-764(+)